jgi:hypothetical protein
VKPPKRKGWAVAKGKENQALKKQSRALGGFKERLEALYGIRKDAK